jgi:hypothetical protein
MLRPGEQNQTRAASVADIGALIAESMSPQFVASCKLLRQQYQPGDEVVEFCTSARILEGDDGTSGIFSAPEWRRHRNDHHPNELNARPEPDLTSGGYCAMLAYRRVDQVSI